MPSKNMLPKGKRRQSVRAQYREHRDTVREQASVHGDDPSPPQAPAEPTSAFSVVDESLEAGGFTASVLPGGGESARSLVVEPGMQGTRLDAYLSKALPSLSRSRVQTLITAGQVRVEGKVLSSKAQLKGGERIEIEGEPQLPPLHGEPEDIPLAVVYEDDDLAVINKPAGMMVHAGSGSAEHNRGTLVNALLFHFGGKLSALGGELRPGIVHRLDKETSGLILVAKNDQAHRRLAEQFTSRTLRKSYVALLHGVLTPDRGTVDLPISRDLVRRTRMTTRRLNGRPATTHWRVIDRVQSPFGQFTLVDLRIETGRTHQIRVHMQALGHPVVGDTVYGAPEFLRRGAAKPVPGSEVLRLGRNFLHAAELELQHPAGGKLLSFSAPLPPELTALLAQLRQLSEVPPSGQQYP